MESTTQPILCCVGTTVAGRSTQFLMERAFSAQGLDWRALTVEVPENRFAIALDGMGAMNFKALRIFPSLAQVAVATLATHDPIARFIDRITSASRAAEGWQVWDNYGFAALRIVSQKLVLQNSVCWLHGSSAETRSVYVALCVEQRASASQPLQVIWTDAPALSSDVELLCGEPRTRSLIRPELSELTSDFFELHFSMDDAPVNLGLFTAESCDLPAPLCDWMRQADAATQQVQIVGQLAGDESIPPCAQQISQVELTIAAEAYDFERWTEQAADVGLLRDAYDEFCDF